MNLAHSFWCQLFISLYLECKYQYIPYLVTTWEIFLIASRVFFSAIPQVLYLMGIQLDVIKVVILQALKLAWQPLY